MAWSTSIRVVYDNGDPFCGAEVGIFFGLFSGFETKHTDEDGWVEFSYDQIDEDERMLVSEIYIEGQRVSGDFYLYNGDTKSFTKPD